MLAKFVAAIVIVIPATSFASCRIHNDTPYDFVVESGNTSNQSVGGHTETSINPGKISSMSAIGKASSAP